ncbi:hypothetical protein GEMRC1_006104 [Eukaryota sp. GEM-RC1]
MIVVPILFILLISVSSCLDLYNTVLYVNSNPNSLWTASLNHRFSHLSHFQLTSFINTQTSHQQSTQPTISHTPTSLPTSFDVREKWPGCPSYTIRDQGHCGSSWAFSVIQVLSDRFCLNLSQNVILSPQYVISCDSLNKGCHSGSVTNSWDFVARHGVPLDSCVSYKSFDGSLSECPSVCDDGSRLKKYTADNTYDVTQSEEGIMTEVERYGPVVATFDVYSDFLTYKSGIYHHQTGYLLGSTSVKVMGWGEDNGEKYWLVANSWGVHWGEEGFARIRKGINECGIEINVITGQAGIIPWV